MATVYEIVTERIIEALDKGVIPWRKPWKAGRPANLVSKKDYRGCNLVLLGAAPYASRYWLTFRQAQQLGGSVRRGEHGWPVIFWRVDEKENAEEGEKRKERRPILRYYRVFNLEQCDAITPPQEEQGQKLDPIAKAEAVIDGFPAPRPEIRYGGRQAGYRPAQDLVQLPPRETFHSPASFYETIFHELGHATGHPSRLDREGITERPMYGSLDYSAEELTAEICACYLNHEAGILPETLENQAAYIAGWRESLKDDPRALVLAAARAQKAADWILGHLQSEENAEAA